ncbi:MAG: S8 family peptidase, partial [Candidatus Promineifilaceae bacterium]
MNRTNIIGLFITLCLFSVGLPRSFAQTDRASEAQQLAKGLETTGSDVPLAPPNPPIAKNDKLPTQRTATSTSLINLDDFRADPRFAGIDGNGVTTVVLDTGIDLDHPYFGPDGDGDGVADRIVYHYDFAHNDNDASDFHGHGSNVTSIVAGGSTAYSGMAPQANIIHLKVFTDSGAGNFGMTESALQWIVANAATYNIVSVNMSLGDSQNHAAPTTLYGLTDELAALTALDVIVVSSSGNSFYNWGSAQGSGYPGADPFSLSVGAVYDSNAGSFNYGGVIAYGSVADALTPFSQRHHSMSDIFAPGAPISGAGPTGGVVTMHGTSQSAPHIAGIVALMQQLAHQELGRFLNLGEIRSLLITTGVTIYDGDDENDNVTNTNISYKRVDVLALGEAILAMATPPVSGDFHVTNHTPADNGRIVPVNSYAVGTFNQSLLSGSTSDTQFTLHGFQTGSYFGSISANANQLTFGPGANFKPGEPLVATLTRYTKSDAMDLLGDNHVTWQFRADVAGGTGSFIDSSQQLGNAHTQDVALGDLDNDGDLDAFVTDHPNIGSIWINQGGAQSGSIGIYVNSGQSLLGTRSAHAPSSERAPTSTSGTQISLGDIDSDGDLDAIVVGNYEVITLWVNQGGAQSGTAGIFADSGQTITAGGSSGTGALGDLDGDGDLDLVVASRGGWGDGKGNEVLFNQGGVQSGTEGVFIDSGQQLGSSDSSDVALGDLDGDGDLDAFFTNDFGQPNEVNINDGNGVFSGSLNSFTGERSTNVELGDLDGDGDLDAFITNGNGPGKPNTVWINQGRSQNGTEGIFLDSGQTLGTENSWDARLGDVDADGDLDAYVSNTISGAFGDDRLWINDGNGNFADSGNQLGHTRGAVNIDMGDVDGDGDLDTFIGVAVGPNEVWLNENAANTACITPPLGMTAWWDLDDTGSIARERVHGNDGVYYSPTSTLGKVSNARSFDGIDDHIIIADADELDVGSGSFSLDFWIKLSPGASDGSVLDKRGTSPNPYGYDVVTIGGYLGLRLDTLTSSMTTSTQQRVDDGEWHLVVYT